MTAKALMVGLLFIVGLAHAEDSATRHSMHHGKDVSDDRVSLNLSPAMKQHQLKNMRAHLVAVQEIIMQLGLGNFSQASRTAHQKLGLTKEMESMCHRFENEAFTAMGIGFHKSADELGKTLTKGDMEDSLAALSETMSYCVACHEQFKQ